MGTLYIALAHSEGNLTDVATGTALKTLLQVATPSTTDIRVFAWGVSFKGVVSTNPPGEISLVDTSGAATVTSLTPDEWESEDAQASLCVGGTTATGVNASGEGTPGASKILDGQAVHPQTGYAVWFPEGRHPKIKASKFLRIRCTFTVDVNAIPWIIWEEPA